MEGTLQWIGGLGGDAHVLTFEGQNYKKMEEDVTHLKC